MTELLQLDCGHAAAYPKGGTGAAGYGYTEDGTSLCYGCCYARELAEVLTAGPGDVVIGYLGAGYVTTWIGAPLLRVTHTSRAQGFGGPLVAWQAVDGNGGRWYGKGLGRGMHTRCHKSRANTNQ